MGGVLPPAAVGRTLSGVTETDRQSIDLAAAVRALRRRADASQRELAKRSGVPATTIGRIEAGTAQDPKFRTVERLVAAAGGAITIGGGPPGGGPLTDPHDGLTDEAGRRYPAHLDVRRVAEAKDWWGAWWASWYDLPRQRWPREAPDHTFDLNRTQRDRRRQKRAGQARAAAVQITRPEEGTADHGGPPPNVWRWTATDPDSGAVVGWLGGFLRRRRVDREREFVLCDIEVAPGWRGYGLGRRLVEALRAELRHAGVRRARVLVDEADLPRQFFRACGFLLIGPQPAWLMLPAGAGLAAGPPDHDVGGGTGGG